MKIALLADIHANLVALQTVAQNIERWQPDIVVVIGDVVNRGPRPLECLRFVQEKQQTKGWLLMRGNHEDYVIGHAKPREGISPAELEIQRSSRWTYDQLNQDILPLKSWPFSISYCVHDSEVRLAHASMRHNRDGIYLETPDEILRQQMAFPQPGLFGVGHTHKPLVRLVDETLVVNVGAVGLPFDGDPRACYARAYWQKGSWRAAMIRVDYDRQQADQDFVESGMLEGAGPLARLMRVELRLARSQIAEWVQAYQDQVKAGALTVDEAVTRFLADEGTREAVVVETESSL